MAVDRNALIDEVRGRLNVAPDQVGDPQLQRAVDAAIAQAATYTGVDDLPADDANLDTGIVLLGMRIYQDTPTPGGEVAGLGDDLFGGRVVPRDVLEHIAASYFEHLVAELGCA